MKLRYMKRQNGDALIMLLRAPLSEKLVSLYYYTVIEWLWSNETLSVLYADPSLDGLEVLSELGEPSLATIALLRSYERDGKACSDSAKRNGYEAIMQDMVFRLCCSSTEVISYFSSFKPFYPQDWHIVII
jgi:hypothetical protein